MAGSKQPFMYNTDIPSGTAGIYKQTVLNLDESNTLLLDGIKATDLIVSAAASADLLLTEVDGYVKKPRTIVFEGYTAGGRLVRRELVAPDQSSTLWKEGGSITLGVFTSGGLAAGVEDVVFRAVLCKGEVRGFKRRANPDTGLDDGTNP